ncbi:MAG TPA: TonB-dependent receptor [Novosphingobium sp.]
MLANAAATLVATPAFAADEAADAADASGNDIVVTGTREALRAAAAEKRTADNVVEALHANDVGKLPDQNVAEAVKRLPGLSVANDQGEGRYVIIRGIDPSLVNVSLNNQTLPAPEPDGRQVKLDDLPSAMIQSITVTKSLLASQDANAIGGDVNIRTKNAFDSKDPFFFDARGSVGWYDMNHKSPYELDGTIGGRFGQAQEFGAVVSVNYSRRPIESENFQGSEAYNAAGVPDGNGLRDYNLTRTRLGVVGNFDWRPSDGVKLYLRTSYSKFQDHETRDQNRLAITDFVASPLKATGTILVRHREEDDNTKSATLGGEFDLGGGTLEASGGWTKAVKRDPVRSEFTFTTAKGAVRANFDPSTYPYTLAPTGATAGVFDDPNQFTFSKVNFETRRSYEELWQGRVDYTHPVAIGDDSSIKVGFKYLDRHKADDHDRKDYKSTKTAWGLGTVGYTSDPDFYDMFHFGQRINWDSAVAFMNTNPAVVALDPAGTLSDTLSADYDVREEIIAGYAMATIKAGALTVIPGVRVEHTRDRAAAKSVDANSTLTQDFNVFGRNSYTDVFPGLNVKYEIQRDLILRGAVTTSIGRPNYTSLAPFVLVEDDTVPNITLGNPNLKPYKALNFDASLEFYPTPDTVLSAGFFHKEIDNPIYVFSDRQTNVTFAGLAYPTADVSQPLNADKERVSGVEFNLQYQFSALPGFLGGFGLSANYSHVWGDAKAPDIRTGKIPLMFQSKDVGNVALFYEKYGLAARLAFNYRSAYLDLLGGSTAEDEYTDGNGQLDLHVSYQVLPQVTVFGDAINLTNAPWRRYIGQKDLLVEREQYGAQLRGGVQMHF